MLLVRIIYIEFILLTITGTVLLLEPDGCGASLTGGDGREPAGERRLPCVGRFIRLIAHRCSKVACRPWRVVRVRASW